MSQTDSYKYLVFLHQHSVLLRDIHRSNKHFLLVTLHNNSDARLCSLHICIPQHTGSVNLQKHSVISPHSPSSVNPHCNAVPIKPNSHRLFQLSLSKSYWKNFESCKCSEVSIFLIHIWQARNAIIIYYLGSLTYLFDPQCHQARLHLHCL